MGIKRGIVVTEQNFDEIKVFEVKNSETGRVDRFSENYGSVYERKRAGSFKGKKVKYETDFAGDLIRIKKLRESKRKKLKKKRTPCPPRRASFARSAGFARRSRL